MQQTYGEIMLCGCPHWGAKGDSKMAGNVDALFQQGCEFARNNEFEKSI